MRAGSSNYYWSLQVTVEQLNKLQAIHADCKVTNPPTPRTFGEVCFKSKRVRDKMESEIKNIQEAQKC